MPRLGPWELAIILLIVLLVFGASRLPEIGSSMGKGIRYFKDALSGKEEEEEKKPAGMLPPERQRENETVQKR